MASSWDDPDNLPLRFNPPDGWRTPDPTWVALHQGFEPPLDWEPYPGCPRAPHNWPFWEENGTAWFTFFRAFSPPPGRALGWWFSMMAVGLLVTMTAPFALPWPAFLVWGLAGFTVSLGGLAGVIRQFRRQAAAPTEDPMAVIRRFASARRQEYFTRRYQEYRQSSPDEKSLQEFIDSLYAWWWRETS